ncbi:MAG TPA: L-threonylcarbamoyladenylate synthase [bacterium]|jgi:L-threonylcarbamoyladenylate synthase
MQLIDLDSSNMSEAVAATAEAARRGDLILFPTDTVYGLGGMAFSKRVLEKLRRIKPERGGKPTAVLIDNIIRMSQCGGDVPGQRLVALAETFWPGPLTMVWKASNAIPAEFQTTDHSLGYRVPNHPFLLELLRELETPMWATSANLPGHPAPRIYSEIKEAVLNACDLVIQTKEFLTGKASTVVDVRGREPLIIRESGVKESDIRKIWKNA